MLGLRAPISRSPQFVAFLILLNLGTLYLWISSRKEAGLWIFEREDDAREWTQQEAVSASVKTVTITVKSHVTKTTTVTKTVEAKPKQEASVKIPGPPFCDACGPEDALCQKYGEHNLARSRVFEGSNARFRRVIANAMAGKPTKIGILGGSVTKGHGLMRNNLENWTIKYLEAWKRLFPKSETTLINGAVPATGSDYYSMCFGEHIDEDVDLVIVELMINDQRIESNAYAFEWLMRGLMALPKSPAILNIHAIGLSFELITTGGDYHTPTAEYYDSPVLSVRNMLATHIYKNPKLDEYYFGKLPDSTKPDWRHVNVHGHEIMADLLAAYTERQICALQKEKAHPQNWVDKTEGKLPGKDVLEEIPRLRLFQKYDRESVTGPIKPFCLSTRTTKHPLTPLDSKGWEIWTFKGRLEKPYLRATAVGSYAKFNIVVGVMHRVRITYLRSKTFGLGDVWCWLDDNRDGGKRIESWWNLDNINIAFVTSVSEDATPGPHVLTCEVMQETKDPGGGHEFRLIAVDAS